MDLACIAAAEFPLDSIGKSSAVWHFKPNNGQSSDWMELRNGDDEKPSSGRLLISDNFTLTIDIAELNDSGLYKCSLSNGSEISHEADDQTQLMVVGKCGFVSKVYNCLYLFFSKAFFAICLSTDKAKH